LFADLPIGEAIGVLPAALFIKDCHSRVVFTNRACDDQWGVSFADLEGTDGSHIFPPEQIKLFLAKDQEVFAGGKQIEFDEQVWNAKLQEDRTVHTIKKPIYDADGHPLYLIGMMFDITDRTRVDEELRNSRKLLQTIIDAAPVRVFWKDENLRYLGCNPAFARDAGKEAPAELLGKDDWQLAWAAQASAACQADDRTVMASGAPKLFYEEKQSTPDGRTQWLSTSKVPLKNDGGAIIGLLGIYQDITARKLAEDSLRRVNRALRVLGSCNLALAQAHDEAELLEIVLRDRAFQEDIGRRRMIEVFDLAASQPQVVSAWRRKLGSSLNVR
jgi:PAS domain S-box-containing protein